MYKIKEIKHIDGDVFEEIVLSEYLKTPTKDQIRESISNEAKRELIISYLFYTNKYYSSKKEYKITRDLNK